MTQFGFNTVIQWLRVEREEYQTKKFDYVKEANKKDDFAYWEQQLDSYIQRLSVFPSDSQQYAQAALKLAATAIAHAEHIADRMRLPKPGVSSGNIEDWYVDEIGPSNAP